MVSRPADQVVVTERVRQRTKAARRRRFMRRAVLFAFLTAGMLLASLAHRDAQSIKRCRAWTEHAVRELSAKYKDRMLPLLLPYPEGDRERVQAHYTYEWKNDRYFKPGREVGIGCCKQAHSFFLRPNGRYVILHDGQEFRCLWMGEEEFRRRAAQLMLPVRDED
jgi:hypothetical protein